MPSLLASLLILVAFTLSPVKSTEARNREVSVGRCSRIISLAPSITETLYALGLGERVVGVTRFCDWPPEADAKPEVGGYFDPNIEAIIALEPDLVVMLPGHDRLSDLLSDLGIEYLILANETVSDIIVTIRSIGGRCGVSDAAECLADSLETVYEDGCQPTVSGRPRVLVVVDRDYGAAPEKIFAAGKGTWYDELITAAGGANALGDTAPLYPMLSPESIVFLSPDLIIDIVPGAESRGLSKETIAADWKKIDILGSAAARRVHVLTGKECAVPGPRFVVLMKELCVLIEQADRRRD
jgi:iron complex transport system substrate-binding protein